MDEREPSVDELVALLTARVEQRRAAGEYPDDLEATLDAHYRRLVGPGPGVGPEQWADLDSRVAALGHPPRARLVGLARVEEDLAAMRAAIETLARLTRAVHDDLQQTVTQQLDDLRSDLGRIGRAVAGAGGTRAVQPGDDEPAPS